jgi:long-chain acyl-CoA synthetase
MLHNEPIVLELTLAARQLGINWCVINWNFKAAEVEHVLKDSGAKLLIVHSNLTETVKAGIPETVRVFVVAPRERTRIAFGVTKSAPTASLPFERWETHRDRARPIQLAPRRPGSVMVYTSGTTGLPKGIRRCPPTTEQLQQLSEVVSIVLGIGPGMRALVSAPLYHSAPANYLLQAALQDAHLWIEPRFDAERTLSIIAAQRITHAYLVPTMFRRLLQLPPETKCQYDLRSLRFVASTGAPCPPDIKCQMIQWWGPIIHEAYAASELGWISHIDSVDALQKPGSVGRPVPGTILKILAEDGEERPAGQVGLIYVRQAAVPDFTYNNNALARRQIERDALWTLGDMGFVDTDGYLYVVDRKSDMVISGGVNIYPAEIESVLVTMPGVADCAVFGVPDDDFGESLVAVVQPADGALLDVGQVQSYLRERIAAYKVPRQVTFHEQLPREDTGKIFKRKLRDPYWENAQRRV